MLGGLHCAIWIAHQVLRVDLEEEIPDNFVFFEQKTETTRNIHVPVSPKVSETII